MAIQLDVPYIQQPYSMACWWASANMLAGFRQQCIDPLDDSFRNNTGLTAAQFIDLAKAVGLTTTNQVNQTFAASFLENLLNTSGPVWAAGQWNGANHIIVVVGVVDDMTITIHDPGLTPGASLSRGMDWFNNRIDKNVPIPLMTYNP